MNLHKFLKKAAFKIFTNFCMVKNAATWHILAYSGTQILLEQWHRPRAD